jgi:hypothetical protein
VLVLIAGIATILSSQMLGRASGHALHENQCSGVRLGYTMLQLELGQPPETLQAGADPMQVRCVLAAMRAELFADFHLLFSYSLLTFAIFLFLAASFEPRAGGVGGMGGMSAWLPVMGASLATAMLLGDSLENHTIYHLLRLAGSDVRASFGGAFEAALPAVFTPTLVKWAALALAALAIGITYVARWKLRGVPVALLAAAVAVLFFRGLTEGEPALLGQGMQILALFWLTILIHAFVVVIGSLRHRKRI